MGREHSLQRSREQGAGGSTRRDCFNLWLAENMLPDQNRNLAYNSLESPPDFPTTDGNNACSGNAKLTKPPEGGALLPFTGLRGTPAALSTQGLLGRRWHRRGGWGHPSGLLKTRVPRLVCGQWTTSVSKSSVREGPSTCLAVLLRIKATSCKSCSVRPGTYQPRRQNCSYSSGF